MEENNENECLSRLFLMVTKRKNTVRQDKQNSESLSKNLCSFSRDPSRDQQFTEVHIFGSRTLPDRNYIQHSSSSFDQQYICLIC